MPTFKPKTNKKIKVEKNKITTLDGKHREILDSLNEKHVQEIPNLKQQKKALKKKQLRPKKPFQMSKMTMILKFRFHP